MKNVRTHALLALVASAGIPLACSDGGAVNIGSNTQATGAQLSDYAASWDGYVEAYSFSDGSDRVRLTIDASGNGTVQVGDSAPLAPATNPNVGYPAGAFSGPGGAVPSQLGLVPGFSYPLHAAQVQTDRIQLGIAIADLWSTWCALQTPVPITGSTDGAYGCVDNLAGSMSGGTCVQIEPDGTNVPIDCGKESLCQTGMVCTCTATACVSETEPAGTPVNQYPSEIDGALDSTGSTLTATMTLPNGPRVTVVLTKQ